MCVEPFPCDRVPNLRPRAGTTGVVTIKKMGMGNGDSNIKHWYSMMEVELPENSIYTHIKIAICKIKFKKKKLSKPWHFRVTTGNHPQLIPSEKRWVGLQCFRGGIPAGEIQYIQYRITEDRRIGLSKIYPALPSLIPFHRRFALRRGFFGCLGYGAFGGLKAASQAEGQTAPGSAASDFRARACIA